MQSQRLRIGTGRFQVQLVNVQDFGWQNSLDEQANESQRARSLALSC